MLLVYADRVNKKQIGKGAVIYYFKNSKGKVLGIGFNKEPELKTERILLHSDNSWKFIDCITLIPKPEKTSEVKYWLAD